MEKKPPVEFNDLFFITVTLHPRTYRTSIWEQSNLVREYIDNEYKNYQISGVMELTKQYNIHMHFVIRWKDAETLHRMMYNHQYKYRWMGFFNIKTVRDDGVIAYMQKDIHITNKYKGLEDPYLKDDLDLFNLKQRFIRKLKIDEYEQNTMIKQKIIANMRQDVREIERSLIDYVVDKRLRRLEELTRQFDNGIE